MAVLFLSDGFFAPNISALVDCVDDFSLDLSSALKTRPPLFLAIRAINTHLYCLSDLPEDHVFCALSHFDSLGCDLVSTRLSGGAVALRIEGGGVVVPVCIAVAIDLYTTAAEPETSCGSALDCPLVLIDFEHEFLHRDGAPIRRREKKTPQCFGVDEGK